MQPQDLQSSPKPYTRATLDDKTGLLGATNTAITAAVFGPSGGVGVTSAFAGAEVTANAAGKRIFPRTLTITTAVHASTYKTGAPNALVATGLVTDALGVTATVSENFLLTLTNGGETIRGSILWDDPTQVSVAVPAQNDALGSWTVGVGDIGCPRGGTLRGIKAHAAGTILLKGQDGFIDGAVMGADTIEPTNFSRLLALGTTAVGVTVYA